MKIIEGEQGGDEWLKIRSKIPTASNFTKIVTSTGAPSKSREAYANEICANILMGGPLDLHFKSDAMQRGNEQEEESRQYYTLLTDNKVRQVMFCINAAGTAGCSPDGLIDDDGGLELKNPLPHTHVEYLLTQKVPAKYMTQIQGCMFVTGRSWWDFMSYCPNMQPFKQSIERDKEFISKLESGVEEFQELLSKKMNRLEEMGYV